MTDEELVAEALRLCRDDQLLRGLRAADKVEDRSLITPELEHFLELAALSKQLRENLYAPPSEGWTKQGESHGDRDFITYYKVVDGSKLWCRIESVIEASLYVPFLAVMNETDLYDTWVPKWNFPFKLGINRSTRLRQRGRVDQVVQLAVDMPWPLNNREIVFWGYAEEDGAENQDVGAKLQTVDETFDDGNLVPPPENGVVRMKFESEFMFRPCPPDHPALIKSKTKYPEGEKLILLTFCLYVDPLVRFVPKSFMNFCTRTAVGTVWRMILRVSEDVREEKRPAHKKIIAEKREFFSWVEARAKYLTGEVPPESSANDAKDKEESKTTNN